MKKIDKTIWILLGIFAFIALIFFMQKQPSTSPSELLDSSQSSSFQKFTSRNLRFEIKLPKRYRVENKNSSILIFDDLGHLIKIGSSGTNYNNLNDYLSYLENKNSLQIQNRESLTINDLPTIKAIIKSINDKSGELTYFIYVDYTVYYISTSYPELYGELDNIAKSFHYIPR